MQVILLCLCSWTRVMSCFFSWWTLYWRWAESSCTAIFWVLNKTRLMSSMFPSPLPGPPEHKPDRGVHGSHCREPNFSQRYDPCNPSAGWGETEPPKVGSAFAHLLHKAQVYSPIPTDFYLYISREIIRRKAVLALYKFYLIAPNQVQHIHNKFRKALCDKDPGVMTASLHIYLNMIQVYHPML